MIARLSLRTQLSLLVAGLVLLACAAVGVASTVALRGFLLQRLDQQLALAGNRYAVALEHNDPNDHDADNAATTTLGQSVGTLGVRISGGQVTEAGVVAEAGSAPVLTQSDRQLLARLTPGKHSIALAGLGEYRVLVAAGQDGDMLVTGLPEHPVHDTLGHVILAESVAFAVVVLAGVGGGLFAVRRAMRPLNDVTATALRVSELPLAGRPELAERVEVAQPGTEVGRLSLAVNHMLDQVEAALQERQRSEDRLREFAADASHELRTPVAVVRSHSELIAQQAPQLPAELTNSLERITAESARMGRLVDELLLLARLDAGQPLRRVEVDLSRIAVDAVDDARVTDPSHTWVLRAPAEPVLVPGDPDRLQQVLVNLLSNVRNHTPSGTRAEVSLTVAGPWARLVVLDNGPGIPPELLPRITERFVKGDARRNRASNTTGLGLSIVAGVIHAHGGRFRMSSEPGCTTAELELPLAAAG
ncbi:MAG TPA: HAMP domain-containing sensor histidine kinase [Jatrophihabitans sp.]|nr:HAMP domain-containing sensor histidine kinase [Jatrophihabitans sp.]